MRVQERVVALRWRQLCLCLLMIAAPCARAQNLEHLDQVDLVSIDPRTSQIQLVIILGTDHVNTRPALKALYKKFNKYQDFITSGQAAAAAPTGSKSLPPTVVVMAPQDATIGEMQNIAGLKLAASRVGAEIEVFAHDAALRPRPVAIKALPRRTAGS